ncbi:MAG: hypothetical protein NDI63_13255 [Pseudobdellovibrio sp.]|nr:hypothetical protein [Pseudobdellovibrio sp.]
MTDNLNFNHRLNNNSGSIVVMVMMGVVVMGVVVGMMFYVKNATDALSFIISKGSTRAMTEDVIGSILNVYSQPLEGTSCDTELVAAALTFRDLTNTNPTTFTWETNPSNSPTPPTVNPRNCILSPQIAGQLERVTIIVTPLPTSEDLMGTRRELRIEIRLQKKRSVASQSVIRHYSLSLLSLDRYGVIFNSSQPAAFDIDAASKVYFDSLVLHSNKSTPFTISALVGYPGASPKAVFKQQVYTLADRVTAASAFQLAKFNTVFEKGIIDKHLSNVRHFPTTYPAYSWSEPVDYHYVYANSLGIQDLSPLPRVSGKTSTNGDGNRYNGALAGVVDFPNSSILQKLAHTCDVGISGSAISKIMVLYRADSEVTLDFNSDSDPLKFCGLLTVKKLTVKLRAGKTHYLFGKFYFDQIKVTGGGELFIVDPELDTVLSQNYDAVISMTELRREMKTLEVYIGNPYYQPINSDLTKLHANYGHKMPSDWFSGQPQKDLAGNTIAPGSEVCDGSDWCWPNYMRSYRRHLEANGMPNISVLFNTSNSFNRTLIFNVTRTL